MKKIITTLVLGVLIGGSTTFAANGLFKDLSSSDWYASAALDLADKKIIEGFEDGTFRGNQELTRGEMVVILDRLINYMQENNEDLDDYYISEDFGLKFIKNDRFDLYEKEHDGPVETRAGIGRGYDYSKTERIQFYYKDENQSIESAILSLVEAEGKNPDDCVVLRDDPHPSNNGRYIIDLKNKEIEYNEEELSRIQEADEQADLDGGPFNGEWMRKKIYNERRMQICSHYADASALGASKSVSSYFEYNDYVAKDRFIYVEESYDPQFYEYGSFEFLKK